MLRYGLVVLLVWIGALKFVDYEADAIQGLVANSPLVAWGYRLFSPHAYARLIGVSEILCGVLIAVRPFAPRVSAVGSLGAMFMFLLTLSFLLTTPGMWQAGYGFPFLSGGGQFLAKDVVLLGAAMWMAGEALRVAHGAGQGVDSGPVSSQSPRLHAVSPAVQSAQHHAEPPT